MPALREDKAQKTDYFTLLAQFGPALDELSKAKSYGHLKHQDMGEGINGWDNWRENLGTKYHRHWVEVCLSAGLRHAQWRCAGHRWDVSQKSITHLAFANLNFMMVQIYDAYERHMDEGLPKQEECLEW